MSTIFFINQYASHPNNGGGGRSYYLANEFAKKGYKSVLVCSANHHLLRERPKFKGLWKTQKLNSLTIIWLKTFSYKKSNSPIRILNWFLFSIYLPFFIFSKYKPDIINYSSPSPVGFLGAWLLARMSKALAAFDVRDVWPETLIELGGINRKHPFIVLLSFIEKFCYQKADIITSNLANFDKRLIELKLPTTKFTWIPNGVNREEIDDSVVESKICLPAECENKFVVSYTGTIGDANALDDLIDAAIELKEIDSIHFLLVGAGGEKERLESRCKEIGLTNVTFYGSVIKNDSYRIQSLVDALCVGSKPTPLYRYGTSPNKLYEYMYSKTPVIYHIDSPDYHPIQDADCGIEVKSGEAKRLKEAVLNLKDLPSNEYERLGKSGRQFILEHHTYSALASCYEQVLQMR